MAMKTTRCEYAATPRRRGPWRFAAGAGLFIALVVGLAVASPGIATGSGDHASDPQATPMTPATPVASGDKKGKKAKKEKKAKKSYDELIEEMNRMAKRALYGAALKRCQQAYGMKPSNKLATKCGMFACRAKNISRARYFYGLVDAQGKRIVRQFCLVSGVDLEHE